MPDAAVPLPPLTVHEARRVAEQYAYGRAHIEEAVLVLKAAKVPAPEIAGLAGITREGVYRILNRTAGSWLKK